MLNRRIFLAGATVAVGTAGPVAAAGGEQETLWAMRGALNAEEFGISAGGLDSQTDSFVRMLQVASDRDMPVFLPPGTYIISNLTLPRSVRLSGVRGATRVVFGGDGHLLIADNAELIELTGIVFDGTNRGIAEYAQGLIDFRNTRQVLVSDCEFLGSGKSAISLERTGGRITGTTVSGAAEAGILAVESTSLEISANTISNCGDGGILVHRWQPGEDRTMVTGNRISNILARSGGTGQNGNGINVFRANGVIVSNNMINDCAFSAIRGNSASNLQIIGNNCLRSGETAIYSEFSFEGAVIGSNIVDGAANGISVVNFDNGGRLGTCSGNLVRNLSAQGPYEADAPGFGTGIAVEADAVVSGNVIENAPLYGINLGWGKYLRNVVATANVIRLAKTGIGVSVVEGAGAAVITDNLIEGAENGAIVGHRWSEPMGLDLALERDQFANVTAERNRIA